MKTKILVCLTFLCLGLLIWMGVAYSAEKGHNKPESVHISTMAPAPENGMPPAPGKYSNGGLKYAGQCTDIFPGAGTKIEHTQIGSTWYEFQQNGSMGRMIAVTSDGYRESGWMYTSAVYPGTGRYIRANTEPPTEGWVGATNTDGGSPINPGYSNTSTIDGPPGAADLGATVLIYHRTGGSPIWYTTLCVDDEAGGNFFTRKFDVPDYITGSTYPSEWPKAEVHWDSVAGKDYIHIVGTEGNTAGGVPVMVTYIRCYIQDGPALLDTLVCQTFNADSAKTYKVVAGANDSGSNYRISHFDSSCSITPVVVTSKFSRRVSVAWLRPVNCNLSANHCDYLTDVCFIESMNSGEDWVDGTNWPPPEYNVTNYGCGGTERGFSDLNACYDYQDSLHIVYVTAGFDSTAPGYYQPGVTRLYHWSKKSGIDIITNNIQGGCNPGAHNINIAKMSISALNPIYNPWGDDGLYLFTIWTQFDSADISANGFSNGELYGCGSNTGGQTWGNTFNLTNTPTPNCASGSCLSEHWSSLAQNMYNGDLHIQYICDKDAGGAIQDTPSEWLDNPVMYLRLSIWDFPPPPCAVYQIVDPATWYGPPLKVAPNGTRNLTFKINNCGYMTLIYSVNSDNSCILVSIPPTSLPPQQFVTLTAVISGSGACNGTFISGNVNILTNDPHNPNFYLPVQAIVTDDYYECPRDPSTFDTLSNGVMRFYVNANSQEWIHDISTRPDTTFEVFWNGGPFVATTENNDTLVGRYYGDNDQHALAREQLELNAIQYNDFWLEYSWNISIHKLNPPVDTKWWWFDILHENVFFKSTASDDLKRTVIKFATAERHDPPVWWPSHPTFSGYEDTYLGYFMDIDCPYDSNAGQSARNSAGYDATNHIAWTKGSSNHGEHPAYDDYYAGMALIAGVQPGESTVPAGTYNLANDIYLYPQSPWGWRDGQFYQLAKGTTVGAIQYPDSLKDRSQIVTARYIPAGNISNARASFTIVETFGSTGLAELQSRVASARVWVQGKLFILCGDINNDGSVDAGDIIGQINYLYKGFPNSIAEPRMRGDVNSSGGIEIGDIVLLISYLYKSGPFPRCPGVW